MGSEKRQEALAYLLEQAEKQGYVTFDNIMDCADSYNLPIQDFDWLSSSITTKGIIVYDEVPITANVTEQDDEYDDYAQSDYEAVYDKIVKMDEALEPFISAVRSIRPPQYREFSQLKYQVIEGNQYARERMIEMHLRVAMRIALQRAEAYDMDIVDAVGEACVGLVTAIDKYNPDTNGAFASYASMWILQNLSRRQSTLRPLMYFPIHKKEEFLSVYPELKAYGCILCPDLWSCEKVRLKVGEQLQSTNEQTEDVISAFLPFESFEELCSMFLENNNVFEKHLDDDKNVPEEFLVEENIDDLVAGKLLKEQLKEVLGTLTDREEKILDLRFGLNDGRERTLEEVGNWLNITRERVRQIEASALRKLRHPSRSHKLRDYLE